MSAWLTRYDEAITLLAQDDIDILSLEDVAGWMAIQKAGLTEERRERLTSSLPDEHFPLERSDTT